MKKQAATITAKKYEEITARIKELKSMSKSQLQDKFRGQSMLDLGSLKDMSKTDLVYAVLNNEYRYEIWAKA